MRALCDRDQLVDCDIQVCDPRSATDGALGIADSAQQAGIVIWCSRVGRVLGKDKWIEPVPAIVPGVLSLEWRQLIGLARQLEVKAVHELVVCRGRDANGK